MDLKNQIIDFCKEDIVSLNHSARNADASILLIRGIYFRHNVFHAYINIICYELIVNQSEKYKIFTRNTRSFSVLISCGREVNSISAGHLNVVHNLLKNMTSSSSLVQQYDTHFLNSLQRIIDDVTGFRIIVFMLML